MDKFDVFTNKDADAQPTQYTASRQKKIARLIEKVFLKSSPLRRPQAMHK